MKVSLNWLKEYVQVDESPETIGDILTDIGLEVEGMETTENIKGGLSGLVIGHVESCEKHPNADKLSVTKVRINDQTVLDIVCGAPNVAVDQKVVVAPVGTTLYPTKGEAFKIKKGKIRGQVSEGMICAEDEIGLGDAHDGIMVLDQDAEIGQLASAYFADQLSIDTIYDIGLTPNRSDATGHIGVAFDLAAALKTNFEKQGEFTKPNVEDLKITGEVLPIHIDIRSTELCPRYSGIVLDNIQVTNSPQWIQDRLKTIGQEPLNNVVDITNFILHEFGQPLHAFDYDKIAKNQIIVKTANSDEKFICLDGVEKTLTNEDLVICDGNEKPMCIAGVYGGLDSGVNESTTRIFLESAFFDATSVRRTSMRHLLRTDAATRFEKGTDPEQTCYALQRAVHLLCKYANARVCSDTYDVYPTPIQRKEVKLSLHKLNSYLGFEMPTEKLDTILGHLEFTINQKGENHYNVSIPTNKSDVTRQEDVIEEILRIYGYNKIEMPTRVHSILSFSQFPDSRKVKNVLADKLSGAGFNEIMSTSMTRSAYYRDILPIESDQLVFVNNTSNQHLDLMRPTMLFSGLETIVHNQNRQNPDLSIFEFGKTYIKTNTADQTQYVEQQHLSLFMCGRKEEESWIHPKMEAVGFFDIKEAVVMLMNNLGFTKGTYQVQEIENDQIVYGLRFHRGKDVLVELGRVNGQITQQMNIKQEVFMADLNIDTVLKHLKKHQLTYASISKYPVVRRDLALVLDHAISFNEVERIAYKTEKKLLQSVHLFDVYVSDEHLGANKKSYSIRFHFQDQSKTLKDKDIDKIMKKMILNYEQNLKAIIRK